MDFPTSRNRLIGSNSPSAEQHTFRNGDCQKEQKAQSHDRTFKVMGDPQDIRRYQSILGRYVGEML
jgi:hypothetical protein